MIVKVDNVTFETCDMNFVAKFGIIQAAEMILEFKSRYNLPFIYDVDQLADFLGKSKSKTFQIVKNCDKMYDSVLIPKKNGDYRNLKFQILSLSFINAKFYTKFSMLFLFQNTRQHITKVQRLHKTLHPISDINTCSSSI